MKPASPQQPAGATAPDKLAISNPAVPGQFVDCEDEEGLKELVIDCELLRVRATDALHAARVHLEKLRRRKAKR